MAKGIKTGGRKKGTVNRIGKDVRTLAQCYTEEAITTLAAIMRTSPRRSKRVPWRQTSFWIVAGVGLHRQ
jgi:hypothetical protein